MQPVARNLQTKMTYADQGSSEITLPAPFPLPWLFEAAKVSAEAPKAAASVLKQSNMTDPDHSLREAEGTTWSTGWN